MKCQNKCVSLIVLLALSTGFCQSAAANCTVSTSVMSFPPYDVFQGNAVQAQGEVLVMCDPEIPFAVKLDAGLNASGDFAYRQMRSVQNSTLMSYNLYLDPAFSRVWGNGIGFSDFYSGVGIGRPDTLKIYGRIPPFQNLGAGVYSDTVIITVEW